MSSSSVYEDAPVQYCEKLCLRSQLPVLKKYGKYSYVRLGFQFNKKVYQLSGNIVQDFIQLLQDYNITILHSKEQNNISETETSSCSFQILTTEGFRQKALKHCGIAQIGVFMGDIVDILYLNNIFFVPLKRCLLLCQNIDARCDINKTVIAFFGLQ